MKVVIADIEKDALYRTEESPETVADITFHGIENDALYIFTDLADEIGIQSRTEKMVSDMGILRQFIRQSGKPAEGFFHKGMGNGLKNKYR